MYRYIIKRLLLIIPVIIGVSFMIFFIMDLAPGNAIDMMGEMTVEQEQALIEYYGYDKSVFYRYILYISHILQGSLGETIITGQSVAQLYFERLPNTLVLALGAIIVSHLISIPLGIMSAIHNGSILDNCCMVLALIGLSMPHFWLGLMLIILFSLELGWLPSGDFTGFKSIILPAITLGTGHTAMLTRTTRSSMIDVIRSDFLRTARAKGVPERRVITKHALRNALIPILTVSGTQLAGALGGAVISEAVFAWPGVGRLIIDAVNNRDANAATGYIIMTTLLTSILLLIVDLLYAFVDPRIKAQYAKGGKK